MSAQLFVNATVFMPGPVTGIDLLISDGRIVSAGPRPRSGRAQDGAGAGRAAGARDAGARDSGATVVDCTGRMIAPLFAGPVAVGGPATFAVVPEGELETIVLWPSRNLTLVTAGVVVPSVDTAPGPSTSPHLGMWIDSTGFIHQELTADGRYDETRGGRRHAYQGAFRIDGDRIVYRDDLGFWAYGRFDGGVLHHGGYTFIRKDS